MQAFLLTSQTFTLVSKEPDAKNSPNGWKSTPRQLERWPVKVLITAHERQHYCPDLESRGSALHMYKWLVCSYDVCRYATSTLLTAQAMRPVLQLEQYDELVFSVRH